MKDVSETASKTISNNWILINAGTGTFCGDTNELVASGVSNPDPDLDPH
jgi:hypothetical protein